MKQRAEGASYMIRQLRLKNVGPTASMKMTFGRRLNVITGDNGLGKSFVLDCAWWAMTRKWPAQVNPRIGAGNIGRPAKAEEASIYFELEGKSSRKLCYEAAYNRRRESWIGKKGRPANPGLILYAMADGSFAVWDPARNYWKTSAEDEGVESPAAYVFTPQQVWDGLPAARGESGTFCNGIIRDWAGWQREKGEAWQQLCVVLEALSPEQEKLHPGKLTRISLNDVRDMPTIKMPYGAEVPLVHLSAAMKRIIALGYCLVWAWQEHKKAAALLGEEETKNVVFLVDEIEAHLHPRWQRLITHAMLGVTNLLMQQANVQLILTTHSPLVMASCEDIFRAGDDKWVDMDLKGQDVLLSEWEHMQYGTVDRWLQGPAFDLRSSRSPEVEKMLQEAGALLRQDSISPEDVQRLDRRMIAKLPPGDAELARWRSACEARKLLKP